MDQILLLVDAAMVGALGVWMAVAVADNWLHPELNEEGVAMVVGLDLMAQDFPEDFARLSHRRITDRRIISRLFGAMRLAETIAALALLAGAGLLLGAMIGAIASAFATTWSLLAVTWFVLIWAGFVIGGNYFAYWYCHQWAQSNHFMLMFWGLFVLVILLDGLN